MPRPSDFARYPVLSRFIHSVFRSSVVQRIGWIKSADTDFRTYLVGNPHVIEVELHTTSIDTVRSCVRLYELVPEA